MSLWVERIVIPIQRFWRTTLGLLVAKELHQVNLTGPEPEVWSNSWTTIYMRIQEGTILCFKVDPITWCNIFLFAEERTRSSTNRTLPPNTKTSAVWRTYWQTTPLYLRTILSNKTDRMFNYCYQNRIQKTTLLIIIVPKNLEYYIKSLTFNFVNWLLIIPENDSRPKKGQKVGKHRSNWNTSKNSTEF